MGLIGSINPKDRVASRTRIEPGRVAVLARPQRPLTRSVIEPINEIAMEELPIARVTDGTAYLGLHRARLPASHPRMLSLVRSHHDHSSRRDRGSIAECAFDSNRRRTPLFIMLVKLSRHPILMRYQRILLAYDGTSQSAWALREGAEIAKASRAKTRLLAVLNLPTALIGGEGLGYGNLMASELQRFRAILERGLQYLRDLGIEAEGHLVQGQPLDEIIRAAETFAADLVVLGYHRRKGVAKWWRTSTSAQIIDHLHCSLLVAITPESNMAQDGGIPVETSSGG